MIGAENYLLCDACFEKRGGGEEKSCSHGAPISGFNVECGRWGRGMHCLGTVKGPVTHGSP
jgi:hypothetical protein